MKKYSVVVDFTGTTTMVVYANSAEEAEERASDFIEINGIETPDVLENWDIDDIIEEGDEE